MTKKETGAYIFLYMLLRYVLAPFFFLMTIVLSTYCVYGIWEWCVRTGLSQGTGIYVSEMVFIAGFLAGVCLNAFRLFSLDDDGE